MKISRRRIRRALAAGGIQLVYGVFRLMPRRLAIGLSRILGLVAWRLDPRRSRVALANLERAFGGELSTGEMKALCRSSYANLAANLPDLSRLSRVSRSRLAALVAEGEEALEVLTGASAGGTGVILLTPHLGNWELLAAYLASRAVCVHFVGRKPYDERLEQLYTDVRTSHGASWIGRGGAFERLEDVLGRGETAIMLIDQDTGRVRGTFVDFFSSPAWTATGPAVLARKTGAVMLPGAMLRTSGDTYRLHLEEPLNLVDTGDDDYDDWENTRRASEAVESLIRRYPEQWTWFHRRWRTRPPEGWSPPAPPPDTHLDEPEGGSREGKSDP